MRRTRESKNKETKQKSTQSKARRAQLMLHWACRRTETRRVRLWPRLFVGTSALGKDKIILPRNMQGETKGTSPRGPKYPNGNLPDLLRLRRDAPVHDC